MQLSIVIITKNEAAIIGKTLQSTQSITNDIVVVDSGSTDDTVQICKNFGANVIETIWEGYGQNKNKGIAAAKNDWILSIDADEVIDENLKIALNNLNTPHPKNVFKIRRKNFFFNKQIRFGELAIDANLRLFNRQLISWNDAAVHENLILPPATKTILLAGHLLHYTSNNLEDSLSKTINYAKLKALQYYKQAKPVGLIKLYFAPSFSFFKSYILLLGFLDGWEGYLIAKITAWYTFLKYSFLKEMYKNKNI